MHYFWALLRPSSPSVGRVISAHRPIRRPFSTQSNGSSSSSRSFCGSIISYGRKDERSGGPNSESVLKSILPWAVVIGPGLGLCYCSSSISDSNSFWAFADSGEENQETEKKPKFLFGDAYRRKVFFKYEKRIRMQSPPEKVFEYFASIRTPSGEVLMTPADLMRAVVPVFSPSESNRVRGGFLKGELVPGELHCAPSNFFMLFDMNNDGLISFSEYIFFVTILSIPESSFSVAFKMFDLDNNGQIDKEEFKKVMALMRTHNRQGARHRDGLRIGLNVSGSVENGGLLEYFFGKDGNECLKHERFVKFLKDLHDEVYMERQQFPSTMRFLGFKDVVLDVKEEVLEEVKVEDVVLDVKEEVLKEEVLEEVKAEVKEEVVWDSQAECRFALLTEADVFGQKFDSEADAHAFYNAYARATGFSIRKDRIKKNGDDMVLSRKWVCSRQGLRDSRHFMRKDRRRRHRAETRVDCTAVFRVRLDRSLGKYVVTHFVSKHNHELADPQCVPFLWSHRALSSADKAEINAMRDVGMKPINIIDLMSRRNGGLHKVGFTSKDLHNYIQSQRKVGMKDGDSEGALGYMHSKAVADPLFYYKYSVDSENRLDRLFWADSRSRLDYAMFGDVLAFDSTYRTNAYNKPFVILAGVSNHFKTAVFGCALLGDETAKTYTWVLQSLMEAMDGKKPVSVLTDGDRAMQQAIMNVFPGCSHRLCMWHLQRNAASNVHKPKFLDDFRRLAFKDCEVMEFDKEWAEVVKNYGIEKHSWVIETYRKRHMWAESYLRGKFFAGMRSTQRCESMNAYFNRFLKRGLRLYEFVAHFDRGVNWLRLKDVEAKAVNDNSFPVMETTLTSLERHGAEVFSRAIFVKFQEEIVAESCLFLLGKQETEDHYMYEVGKYGAPKKVWTVDYKPCNGIMKCSCLKVESVGIPCRHMISVMKREQLRQIPPGCVLSRWMRPTMQDGHEGPFLWNDSTTVTQSTRYGMLSSTFNMVSYYASHLDKEFDEVRKVALQMMCQVRKKWETKDWVDDMANNGNAEGGDGEGPVDLFGVGDPVIVRTKGNPGGSSSAAAPRKPRRCSHCRSIGHTKRTCKKLHCRGVKDECTEEIMNQSQMKRSTDGGSASAAPARCIRRLKNEDDGDDDEEEGSQNEKDTDMADDWSSDDDAENDDEEDNEEGEEDTDIGRPSKKARNYC